MSHLLVFVLVLVLKELVSVLLQLVLTSTLVKCSVDTGELGRRAVDRGHGGATTRRDHDDDDDDDDMVTKTPLGVEAVYGCEQLAQGPAFS